MYSGLCGRLTPLALGMEDIQEQVSLAESRDDKLEGGRSVERTGF